VGCREPARGSVPGVNTATMGRTRKENMMAKYLLLKHYRGGPAPERNPRTSAAFSTV
jgi:hypothetical protein